MNEYDKLLLQIQKYKTLKRLQSGTLIGFYDRGQKYYVLLRDDRSLLIFDNYNSLRIYRENLKNPSLDAMCCIGAYMIYPERLPSYLFAAFKSQHHPDHRDVGNQGAALVLEEGCAPRFASDKEAGLLDELLGHTIAVMRMITRRDLKALDPHQYFRYHLGTGMIEVKDIPTQIVAARSHLEAPTDEMYLHGKQHQGDLYFMTVYLFDRVRKAYPLLVMLYDPQSKRLLDSKCFDHDDRLYIYPHVLKVMRQQRYLCKKMYFSDVKSFAYMKDFCLRFHVDYAVTDMNKLIRQLSHQTF